MVIWLVRLTMRLPRPLARAWKRFISGAASTWMEAIFSSSMSAPWLCSALATADSSVLSTSSAPFFGMKRSCESARPTRLPRTTSAISRHFCGEICAYLSLENVCMALSRGCDLLVAAMSLEDARRGELAQLVADHVLGDQHRNVLFAVVHGQRQANHFWSDHRAARPGLDRLAIVLARGNLHLLGQVQIDERTFLQ